MEIIKEEPMSFEEQRKQYMEKREKQKARSRKYLRWTKIVNSIYFVVSFIALLYSAICTKDVSITVLWGVNCILSTFTTIRNSIYERMEKTDNYIEYLYIIHKK